ncbi:MAG: magnesium transporter CorA family protein [Sinobacteraceae bacterium]|nr:magnesium transporter CorA family protein [Nevskiaceae bacterium]
MNIHYFPPQQPLQQPEALDRLPEEGFIWLDYERPQAQGWEERVEALLQTRIDSQHVEDSHSPAHVSFFDGTSDYDMLIFVGLGAKADLVPLETHSVAFFIFDRLLVTVRDPDAPVIQQVLHRYETQPNRLPRSAVGLAYSLVDTMVDRFLAVRDHFTRQIEDLQDGMLDAQDGNTDWRTMMHARRAARRLAGLSEDQWETIDNWRRNSRFEWDEAISVRLRDLAEHITRIRDLASNLERDLDNAMQLNFAILSQRQNEIMKIFTVISAVFLPLMLLTGIWGMNFANMPELHWKYSYFFALGLILVCGLSMLAWFRRRRII